MDKGLFDKSGGNVVIRDGSVQTENGRDGGFFNIGGGNGFSGGFGGSSSKRAKKRARARAAAKAEQQAAARAAAEAAAQAHIAAQAAARAEVHRQQVNAHAHAWQARQGVIDQHFATRIAIFPVTLQREVVAATTARRTEGPDLALFVANHAADDLARLIARKTTELQQQDAQAKAFNGQDLLSMPVAGLSAHLASLPTSEAMLLLRQAWESSYLAAQEARLLGKAIAALNDRLAETRARAASIELRNLQIRSKQQADEDWRRDWVRRINTLTLPSSAMSAGGLVIGQGGAWNFPLGSIEWPNLDRLSEAAVKTAWFLGKRACVLLAGLEPSTVANGELTPEQRRRMFEGVGVPVDRVGVSGGQDLQAIADAGGTAQVEYRLRLEAVGDTTAIIAVGAGEDIPDRVPVRNAVLDPVTNTYRIEGQNPTDKHLEFTADTLPERTPPAGAAPALVALSPAPVPIPPGVDLRFNDCIVCVPGREPFYFSSRVTPVGQGMVHGVGQPAGSNWREQAAQPQGLAIPAQVAALLGGREFASFAAFETAFWRLVGDERTLFVKLSESERRNLKAGYAPYAPGSAWVGNRWRYEIRYPENVAQGTDPFDLDRIRIHLPSSSDGLWSVEPYAPWIAEGVPAAVAIANGIAQINAGARTWTPLAPPGSETLGPTTLPEEPVLPDLYTGGALDPAMSENETLPGLEEGEIGASIPGYGADIDLPSPGLVFAEPLDVGPYDELARRSVKDGLDIDHIVSRKALQLLILRADPRIEAYELAVLLSKAPSIAIPAAIHRALSETYGGRNTPLKQYEDSLNIKVAVNSNFDAIKPGLLEYGLQEVDIEAARENLHQLHREQGWCE